MIMKKNSTAGLSLLRLSMLLFAILFLFVPGALKAADKPVSTWVKTAKGYQYYNAKGKKLKASASEKYKIFTIKKRNYAFNSKGYQVTGWRQIDGKYYYFALHYGKRGSMQASKTVNGIKLRKTGEAIEKGTRVKKKLPLLCTYQEWTDEVTAKDPYASKGEKLRVCFDYLRRLPYSTVRKFKAIKNRDIWDANYVFKNRKFDCHRIAAAFCYMALCLGYTDVKVHDLNGAWHSTVQIDGYYYDPSLARKDLSSYRLFKRSSYYVNSIWLTTDINK